MCWYYVWLLSVPGVTITHDICTMPITKQDRHHCTMMQDIIPLEGSWNLRNWSVWFILLVSLLEMMQMVIKCLWKLLQNMQWQSILYLQSGQWCINDVKHHGACSARQWTESYHPLGAMPSREQRLVGSQQKNQYHISKSLISSLDTLRPRQNGCHFTDDIFKYNFLNENIWIWLKFHWSLFLWV